MSDDDSNRPIRAAPPARRGPMAAADPFGGAGHAGREVDELRPSAKRLLGTPAAATAAGLIVVLLLGVLSVGFSVIGPKLLGEGDEHHLRGRRSRSSCRPAPPSSRSIDGCAPRADTSRPTCSAAWT